MFDDERAKDINDVAPSSLKHLIGQHGVVEQVKVALAASLADSKRFDSALLVGPPGVGKSAVARIVGEEMACGFCEVIGQSLTCAADLNALLLAAEPKAVVHIDEAHELQKPLQVFLYLALDRGEICIQGSRSKPQSIPLADFTLLLSTTDEYALLAPLRDRMKLVLRFQFYTEDQLVTLVRQRSRALGWPVEEIVFSLIAQRSRGTPRLALRLLQACRRVCRAEGSSTISLAHLERACQLEQIDTLGLGPTEQAYLSILADGTSRLNVVASMLGLPPRTVSQVTEPFLLRAGLILKDDTGRRELTASGREHLSRNRASSGVKPS